MNRKALARRAFNTAVDRIAQDASLSASKKRSRYFRLSSAYEARKSRLDLAQFLDGHGLSRFVKLDRLNAKMAAEHAAGFVGDTKISAMKEVA